MTVESAELRRLLAAATPGPWEAITEDDREAYVLSLADEFGWVTPRPDNDFGDGITDPDAALIAAMRNALPVLLDQLDTYREALSEIVGLREERLTDAHAYSEARDLARAALDTNPVTPEPRNDSA